MEDIAVSIVCNTFNQEKYIEVALKSFLMQETTFKYEILIHDDASNDNTTNIIKEYQKKYPNLIFPLIQEKNKYSEYIDITLKYQYPRARGKYIALCEGDDFWVDKHKLQKQYDFLENHKEYKMCSNASICADADTLDFKYFMAPSSKDSVLKAKDTILNDGGYLATNSLFFRKDLYDNYPSYGVPLHIDDYQLQLTGSYPNGIYYMSDIMSVYRFKSNNSWSADKNSQNEEDIKKSKEKILDVFNTFTDYHYKSYIDKKIQLDNYKYGMFYKLKKDIKYFFIRKKYEKQLDYIYEIIHSLILNEDTPVEGSL